MSPSRWDPGTFRGGPQEVAGRGYKGRNHSVCIWLTTQSAAAFMTASHLPEIRVFCLPYGWAGYTLAAQELRVEPGKGAYVLQQSCECLLNAMTPLHPLQHPVPSQEDQVGFVLFPLLSAQNFNDLHETRM